MNNLKFNLLEYQDDFLFSEARFPCLITSVGTGKTTILLLKAWMHCEQYPDAYAVIVRKEATDLKLSTIKDFNLYFGTNVSSGIHGYKFPNGSEIIFMHGNENDLSALNNMNLSFIGMEQAEEYENEEVLLWLRDRLRRKTTPIRQCAIIANSKGMNWVWKLWVNEAETSKFYDRTVTLHDEQVKNTDEWFYKNGEYECWTANSYVNAHNLPTDTIEDWMSMEKQAPNHYKQRILNSFENLDDDDILLTSDEMNRCIRQEFLYNRDNYTARILGVDIARYGDDKCCAVILEQMGPQHWEEVHFEKWGQEDAVYTAGRVMAIRSKWKPAITVVDGDGLGGPYIDIIRDNGIDVVEYRGGMVEKLKKPKEYKNHNTEYSFFVKNLIQEGRLKLKPDSLPEIQTIRYRYQGNDIKRMVTKEEMRTKGYKSPDHWDAIRMACSEIDNIGRVIKDSVSSFRRPKYAQKSSPYARRR